jgi:hypothetical protein
MMFVPAPKAGCTSIMWALALAQGTVPRLPAVAVRGETRDQRIHDPAFHGLPNLASLRSSERQMVLDDPSWIRFCVTRDPYSRLLSGWINRVLLSGVERSIGADVFVGGSADQSVPTDLGEGFRDFVRRLLGPAAPVLTDRHFYSQAVILRPDIFPYTDVVKIKELDGFVARIAASSKERLLFDPQFVNSSLRIDPQSVFDVETGALVDAYFADDFEQFGYRRSEFAETAGPMPLSKREIELISIVKAKSDRVLDLQRFRARDSSLRTRVARRVKAVRRRLQTHR